MKFIKNPYLPKGKVLLAVGNVERDDINIVLPCDLLNLPRGLELHADLSFCYLGEGVAVCAKGSYDYYKNAFEKWELKIIEGESTLDRHYPLDAAYNVAIVGKKMFCRKDISDRVLLNKAEEMGYEIINMKQGYGKCSVCPIDENSAITGDVSFYRAAEKCGMDVLLVTNDTISLPGFSNGFFGGCAYMCDEKTLCVKGDINTHPNHKKILEFLEKRNIEVICSGKSPLFDFGSFIPVIEE